MYTRYIFSHIWLSNICAPSPKDPLQIRLVERGQCAELRVIIEVDTGGDLPHLVLQKPSST